MTPAEANLWQAYLASRSPADRNAIVTAYMPLLKSVARGMSHGNPTRQAEMESDGAVGLIRAVERHDPTTYGVFAAFARMRIEGEILKGIGREKSRPAPIDPAKRVVADTKSLGPAEVAMLRDLWGWAMGELDERGRRIVGGRCRGLTLDEIGAREGRVKSVISVRLRASLTHLQSLAA